MALVPYPELESLPEDIRGHIEHFAHDHGRPTLLRWMLAWSPPASAAVDALYHPVFTTGKLERRLKEVLFVAASEQRRCFYCMGGHSRYLVNNFGYSPDIVEKMRRGEPVEALDEREHALVLLVRIAARDGENVTAEDLKNVREQGWDEDEIVEALSAASQAFFTNTLAQAMHIEDDVTEENGFDGYF